jgi:hypothetical protein
VSKLAASRDVGILCSLSMLHGGGGRVHVRILTPAQVCNQDVATWYWLLTNVVVPPVLQLAINPLLLYRRCPRDARRSTFTFSEELSRIFSCSHVPLPYS